MYNCLLSLQVLCSVCHNCFNLNCLDFFYTIFFTVWTLYTSHVQGAPKMHFQNALAQTQVTGTPCVKKLTFWSFLAIHKHKNANTPGYIQTSVPPN